jgi:diguanylate cyclase (GGDEF)-like protein
MCPVNRRASHDVAASAARPAATGSIVIRKLLHDELSRRPLLRLQFPPMLEMRYEADTRRARCWHIGLTIPLGLFYYVVFSLPDRWILPDLRWVPLVCRLCLVTPVGLIAMWLCGLESAALRERFISVGILLTALIPIGFMAVSNAPLAPYTMLVVLLVSLFGNATMRIRFRYACLFSALTIAAIAALLLWRADLNTGVAVMLAISTLACVTFGVVANNQLERAERRSYLHQLLETVRVGELSIDKERYSALSLVDPLTGLANRRAFDRRLRELLHTHTAAGIPFALLLADVDHFKRYNDRYGHPAGDACLVRVADILRGATGRKQDLAARYGGEEFAILLTDCTALDAIRIAQAICAAVAAARIAHDNRDDGENFVSISIGVGATDQEGGIASPDDVVAAADVNLYAAKRQGRNRVNGGASSDATDPDDETSGPAGRPLSRP